MTVSHNNNNIRNSTNLTLSNPLAPSVSFSTKPPEKKATIWQKLLSVRVILLVFGSMQVVMLCAVMYGFTYYGEHKITNDLSGRILKGLVESVADTTTARFTLPYFMTRGSPYQLPPINHTIDGLKPYLWQLYLQGGGDLQDVYWGNGVGDCSGYYRPLAQDIVYEMHCHQYESYLYPVIDMVTGASNKSAAVPLYNYSLTHYDWWQTVYTSPKGSLPIWSHVYKDASFPDAMWLTCSLRLDDHVTNETSVISIDVTSEALQKDYESKHVSQNSVIFVMQQDGTLVACSDPKERIYAGTLNTYSAYDSNLEMVRESSRLIRGKNSSEELYLFDFKLHGKTINAYHYTITKFDLSLILVVAYPVNDFFGVLNDTRKLLLLVSSVVFVISLLAGIVVMLLITRPLTKLGKLMDEIANGVFDFSNFQRFIVTGTTKLYEIHLLQEDFNRMANALKAFSRYVPIDIVRYLLRNNAEAVVNMRQKEITVMFSDIKNFTTKVEEMSANQLSLLLSDYLNTMCAVIAETEGTVDKFIGDAVMALWNVPAVAENHPILACSAALKSLMALDQLNRKWNAIDLPNVEVRIGIHTGTALVGNLGSLERLAFTAVGDNVNLGARLESLNKKYGTTILISGQVYEKVKEYFLCRYLDVVVVVGKTTHTHIYELVNYLERTSEKQQKLCNAQADALNLFLEKKFDAALRVYDWLHAEMPDDISIMMLTERAKNAQQLSDDLPEDWTGYLILDDK